MGDKPPMLFVPVDGPAVDIPPDADVAGMVDGKDDPRVAVSRSSTSPSSSTETSPAKRKGNARPFGAAA